MTQNIKIIRSDRRTVSLEIKRDMSVVVRAPWGMSNKEIEKFIYEKQQWLEKHMAKVKEQAEQSKDSLLTQNDIKELASRCARELPPRVELWAEKIGVDYGRITVRNQVSRWGSCSSKGNLNFNCLLMLCPQEVSEYVIIHELCHRKYMNHSPEFWAEVECHCPEYKTYRAWLKNDGSALIRRMGG